MSYVIIESWPPLVIDWVFWDIPIVYLALALGVGLIITGFFVRSPFIYLAVLCCMLYVIFSGLFDEHFLLQCGVILTCIWAILAAIKTTMASRGGG